MEVAALAKVHDAVRLSPLFVNVFIPASASVGIIFAIFLWLRVARIKVRPSDGPQRAENGREYLLEEESASEAEVRTARSGDGRQPPPPRLACQCIPEPAVTRLRRAGGRASCPAESRDCASWKVPIRGCVLAAAGHGEGC